MDKTPAGSDAPEFRGKHVLLYLKGRPDDDSVLLKDVTFEMQMGRTFLVGQQSDGVTGASQNFAQDLRCCVAWETVAMYLVFDSAEQFRERYLTATPSPGWWSRLRGGS